MMSIFQLTVGCKNERRAKTINIFLLLSPVGCFSFIRKLEENFLTVYFSEDR